MSRFLFFFLLLLAACGALEPVQAACDLAHPDPPGHWELPTFTCSGEVHVIVEDDPRAALIVFEEWRALLQRVRASPLAALAERPRPVFVMTYGSNAACVADLTTPYADATYEAARRLVRIGDYRSYEGGEERFREVLRHELTHHLLHGVREDAPRWVDEGIAELFETLPGATLDAAPRELPLTELLAWEGPNTEAVHDKYRASRTLVGGLLRSEAGPAFADLVSSSEPWPRGLSCLLRGLGAEAADLHHAYREQRAWRRAGPLGRAGGSLSDALSAQTAEGLQPWMLVCLPGFLLLVVGVRLAG